MGQWNLASLLPAAHSKAALLPSGTGVRSFFPLMRLLKVGF